ncbi:GNAT family N-acetyltransferase [uncultured Flavonifractor sp.]|uniref:GNAT family N-acetyltransferase n=1 Tax=uncultured Flavonifractor sp. TaxID=1193534 RepID=UPI002620D1FD|nr:N-acetyltransferase [uncultured Flavonifractor sp.]
MEAAYEIFAGEIAAKGTGYLAIRRCRTAELGEQLSRGREELLGLGASQLLVTSSDPEAPLFEGEWDGFSLVHARDLLWMERELTALPPHQEEVELCPLTRGRGGTWLTLHNACFFDMPNSATYGPLDLERALSPEFVCGFVQHDQVPVGVYELDLSGETPVIDGIALHKDFRGRGLGKSLLSAVLELLAERGYPCCRLLVATDNQRAFSLYRSAGFRAEGVRSRWFQMLAK